MHRRRFCCALGAFTAAAGSRSLEAALPAGTGGNLHTCSQRAMGTTVRIVVRHANQKVATRAIEQALHEVELVESLMSIYRPDSELSRLNRAGQLGNPHPYLVQVIRHAKKVSQATWGAFDISVQPLWQLYHASSAAGRPCDEASLDAARRNVGYRKVELVGGRIRLTGGARITLNGIAQGFATDRVKAVLLAHGVRDALIDIGELAGLGRKDERRLWQAGIQHPRNEDAFIAVTPIDHRSLATSGDYQTTFSPDFRDHHIFDPRTGRSPPELSSVSVLAPTATQADALATAFLVMGTAGSARFLRHRKGIDAMFVHKDGHVLATSEFPWEPRR